MERDRILDLLRTEVRKNKLDLAKKLIEPAGAYDVYKVLIGDSSDGSQVVRRKLPPDWELWEAAGKACVAAQQVPSYINLPPSFASVQKRYLPPPSKQLSASLLRPLSFQCGLPHSWPMLSCMDAIFFGTDSAEALLSSPYVIQARISRQLATVQESRQESEARAKAIVAQSGAIHRIRREETEKERRAQEDREALIRCFQICGNAVACILCVSQHASPSSICLHENMLEYNLPSLLFYDMLPGMQRAERTGRLPLCSHRTEGDFW